MEFNVWGDSEGGDALRTAGQEAGATVSGDV
jgi:hypothetical protein